MNIYLFLMETALKGRKEHATVEEWFDRVADTAIRRSLLQVAGTRFAIVEVEFYLYAEEHKDPFVHCSEQQLSFGEWYFHREKAAKIGFTLKGIDLTFGDQSRAEYGGMLIRALARVDGTGIVEGPSKVVDTILTAAGVDSVAAMKALPAYSDRALVQTSLLHLEPRDAIWREDIKTGRRIGLKGQDPFAEAAYRYRARPAQTTKDRASITRGRQVPHVNTIKLSIEPRKHPETPGPTPLVRLTDEDVDELLAGISIASTDEAGGEASDADVWKTVWGVVGYRHFTDYPRFAAELKKIAEELGSLPTCVVSGGATGTDSMAARWARENKILLIEHLPRAPRAEDLLARNTLIVRDSTLIIAFLSTESRGTRDTITKARKSGKPVIEIKID
jgi:hypothetical protein